MSNARRNGHAVIDRQLPYDLDAERATLGSLLLDRDAIIAVASSLLPEHFYHEKHRWVYEAVMACYGKRIPPDLRTIAAELRYAGRLVEVGGIAALAELSNGVPTAYHVEYYAAIVTHTAYCRRLIALGGKLAQLGYEADRTDEELTAEALSMVMETTQQRSQESMSDVSSAVDALLDRMEKGVPPGIKTGFMDLDSKTGGLHGGDQIVLAARPGVGKSSLADAIVFNVATRGDRCFIYSLEMSRIQIVQRWIAAETGINLQSIVQDKLTQAELTAFMDAAGKIHSLPIHIDDDSALSIAEIRLRALRKAAMVGNPALIVVDYLQLISGTKRTRDGNRVQEVSEVSWGLKQLAREMDCCVIALSQLNRAVDTRNVHVPVLSDLRESGSIEQDADLVIFIYRDEMYDKDTDKKGIAELHIAKHRNGPLGVVNLIFDETSGKWRDLALGGYTAVGGY